MSLPLPQASVDITAKPFRGLDLTGGHSRSVQTLILVLARLSYMTLVPRLNSDK